MIKAWAFCEGAGLSSGPGGHVQPVPLVLCAIKPAAHAGS